MKKKILSLTLISLFFIGTISSCTQGKKGTDLNLKTNEINMKNDNTLYIFYQSKVIDSIPHKDDFIKRYEWLSDTNYGENIEEDEIGKEPYHLEQFDLDLGTRVIRKALKIKGLKDVGENQFYKQVYKYFNLTKDDIKSEKKTIFTKDCFVIVDNPRDAGNKDLLILPDINFTYFYPNKSMITNLPDLTFLTNLDDNKNLNLDDKSVDYQYHYSNYILYDSKSSLTWLSINAPWSLQELFDKYRYYKEPKINKIGLDLAYKKYRPSETKYNETNNNVLIELFFEKKDNKLYIHKDLLEYISEGEFNNADYLSIEMMYDCASLMLTKTYAIPNLTDEDRLMVATYLGYYIEPYYSKYGEDMNSNKLSVPTNKGSFYRNNLAFTKNNDLLENIKRNSYYDLPNLEGMVANVLEQTEEESEAWLRSHSNN